MSNLHLEVTAKNFELTPAIQAYVHKRVQPLLKHFTHLSTPIHVVLSVEKFRYEAKAHCHLPGGKEVTGRAVSKDMYESIDELAKILDKQALHHKAEMQSKN